MDRSVLPFTLPVKRADLLTLHHQGVSGHFAHWAYLPKSYKQTIYEATNELLQVFSGKLARCDR
jgi:hypothetical protein